MSLFSKIFRKEKDPEQQKVIDQARSFFATFCSYSPVFHDWKGAIYESELVRACCDARARHAGKLNVQIIGSARPSLQAKLQRAPNQWSTWYQFLYRTSTILDVYNTCFIVPVHDENLEVVGFFPVIPKRCEVVEYKDREWLRYTFSSGKKAAVEFDKCAILTKYQLDDDFFGADNKALDETMNLLHLQNQGVKEAIKSSARFRFMAQMNNWVKPEDLINERTRFTENNFKAESNDSEFLLFPNNYTNIKQIESKPFTIDSEQMNLIKTNCFNYFGVNEKVLQNSAQGDDLDAFFNGATEPFAIQLSEAMTNAIFTPREFSNGNRFQVSANRLQYMTVSEKVSMSRELGDRGAIMIDEIRELFNYPPLPDGTGQHAPIRGEYYMVDQANAEADSAGSQEGESNAV